jgi:CheY-like chemotaxis protein
VSQTISATATLLWPLIVLLALIVFRKPLLKVIRSAADRDVTVKIGGEEVSLGQVSQQQTNLITDLQEQVLQLQRRIDTLEKGAPAPAHEQAKPAVPKVAEQLTPPPKPAPTPARAPAPEVPARTVRPSVVAPAGADLPATPPPWERLEPVPASAPGGAQRGSGSSVPAPADDMPKPAPESVAWTPAIERPRPSGVLWVDDHPDHHAVQVERLQRYRVLVDTARSTGEALEKLSNHRYQLVVSNMARDENGRAAQSAGVDLVRAIRSLDRDTPIAIYANGHAAQRYGDEALAAGANLATGSSFELFEELRKLDLLPAPEVSRRASREVPSLPGR